MRLAMTTATAQIGADMLRLGQAIAAGFGLVWLTGAALIDWQAISPEAAQLVAIITAAGLAFGLALAAGIHISRRE